jgi:tetratricopeptide (TPR) repeat protein
LRAYAYEYLGQFKLALDDFDMAISLSPPVKSKNLRLHKAMAMVLAEASNHSKATDEALEAVGNPKETGYPERAYKVAVIFSLAAKAAIEDKTIVCCGALDNL